MKHSHETAVHACMCVVMHAVHAYLYAHSEEKCQRLHVSDFASEQNSAAFHAKVKQKRIKILYLCYHDIAGTYAIRIFVRMPACDVTPHIPA